MEEARAGVVEDGVRGRGRGRGGRGRGRGGRGRGRGGRGRRRRRESNLPKRKWTTFQGIEQHQNHVLHNVVLAGDFMTKLWKNCFVFIHDFFRMILF